MKTFITLLLSGCCFTLMAQTKTHNNLSQRVHDDGKIMLVEIAGTVDGRYIDYSRKFDIRGMNTIAKNALTKRITDSLGVNVTTAAVPQKPVTPVTPAHQTVSHNTANSKVTSRITDDGKIMQVVIEGNHNGLPYTYNRNFKVDGLSTAKKEAIVKHLTDSLSTGKNVVTKK